MFWRAGGGLDELDLYFFKDLSIWDMGTLIEKSQIFIRCSRLGAGRSLTRSVRQPSPPGGLARDR